MPIELGQCIAPLELEGDYPSGQALEFIKNWKGNGGQLLGLIKPVWRYSDCGYWEEDETEDEFTAELLIRYTISTGGWSGNELLIGAMQANFVFWTLTWYSSRVGGHYVFHLKIPEIYYQTGTQVSKAR